MLDPRLVVAFALFGAASGTMIVRRDIALGVYYAWLLVLAVSNQLVLAIAPSMLAPFYPEVVRVEPGVLVEYWWFSTLSFGSLFAVLMLGAGVGSSAPPEAGVLQSHRRLWVHLGLVGALAYAGLMLGIGLGFELSYSAGHYSKIAALATVLGASLILALYAKVRSFSHTRRDRVVLGGVLLLVGGSFLLVNLRSGIRSSLIALLMSILVYEWTEMRTLAGGMKARRITVLLATVVCGVIAMNVINVVRQTTPGAAVGDYVVVLFSVSALTGLFETNFLMQTYSIPATLLLASIDQGAVMPLEVLVSNLANSLVLTDYPYLSTTVSAISNPSLEMTRRAGFAYYAMNEGYNALGFPGFAYNGLVIGGGLLIWRKLLSGGTPEVRPFCAGLLTLPVLSIVFGQAAIFVKMTYLILLPASVFFYMFVGVRTGLLSFRIGGARPLPRASS